MLYSNDKPTNNAWHKHKVESDRIELQAQIKKRRERKKNPND